MIYLKVTMWICNILGFKYLLFLIVLYVFL